MSAATTANAGAAVDHDNPWPGLASFTEEQSGFFHGRDEEIRSLARLMERKALTVLFGQSGLGKSSLLQAGVFPRLRAASFCPIYIRLDHAEGAPTPAEQVKTMVAVATALVGTWTKPGVAKPGESLWEFFHHRDDRLIDASGRTIVPVLVFDQFEELFTLGAAAGAQRDRAVAFMSELAELVENRPSEKLVERLDQSSDEMDAFDFSRTDYRVCISLREDYLPHLEGLKTIMPALMENRIRLTRMTGMQALDAVLKPGGLLVTPEVARAIVEFVSGARGGSVERLAELDVEPPLLSVICRELNDRRRALGQAQITADLVTGNRREILTDFYERSVADLPEEMRRFVEDKLLTKSGFRDNLALETALEEPGVTRELIDTLVSRRLLRIEDRIGTQRVELTHDVLADVVRASRDARQQRLLLEEAAVRERQALAEAARRARRQRFIIGGLAAALLALSVGAVFGIRAQKRSAAQATRTQMLLGSRLLDEDKLGEGLAYLVAAARRDPTNGDIATRLLTTLVEHRFCLPSGQPLTLPAATRTASYSPDGRWVAVQGEDDVVRILDAEAWRIVAELKPDRKISRAPVRWATKAPGVLAAVLADGSIQIFDVASGRPRYPAVEAGEKSETNFALSPDGRWIAVGTSGVARVWDAEKGNLVATFPNARNTYGRVDFSPDSRRILTLDGNALQVWTIADGQRSTAIPLSQGLFIYQALFARDGEWIWVLSNTRGQLFDASTGEPIAQPTVIPVGRLSAQPVLSPNGELAAFAMPDLTISVLNLKTGQPAFPALPHDGPVFDGGFSRDGRTLFTNSIDGQFRLWNTENGKLLNAPVLQQDRPTPAAMAPDGKSVVVFSAALQAYKARLTGSAAEPLVLPRLPGRTLMMNLQPQGSTLLWIQPSGVRAIDLASGKDAPGGFAFPKTPASVRVSGFNENILAQDHVMLARTDEGWRAWRFGKNGVEKETPLSDEGNTGPFLFSRDPRSRFAVTSSNRQLHFIEIDSGRRVASFPTPQPVRLIQTEIALSVDHRFVAFVDRAGVVQVCDIVPAAKRFELQLTGGSVITSVFISEDGKVVLTGDNWGFVQMWDAGSGKLLRNTQAHRSAVVRFHPAPRRDCYATISVDGSVQVWNSATHEMIGSRLEQKHLTARIAFTPDSSRIVTPTYGGNARVWDVATGFPLTPLWDHQGDRIQLAAVTPDGRFGTTQTFQDAQDRMNQRFWPMPPHGRGTPEWLVKLATLCAGQRLTDSGKIATPGPAEFHVLDEVRRQVAALPAADSYAAWARWFLSEDPDRPIAPEFTLTHAQAAHLREKFASSPKPAATAAAPASSVP